MVLGSKLSLRLNLVEKIVVRVFDIVHQSCALMVVNVVAVDVAGVVLVIIRVVTVVLIGQVVVIVMVASPERSTGVVLLTFIIHVSVMMLLLLMMVYWLLFVVVGVVVEGRVMLSVVHDPFVLGDVRLEQRQLVVFLVFILNGGVLEVDDLFTMVEASMLESPKEFLVSGDGVVIILFDCILLLDSVVIVFHLVVRHDVVFLVASITIGVSVLEGSLVQVAKIGHAMHGKIVLDTVDRNLGVVSLSGSTVHLSLVIFLSGFVVVLVLFDTVLTSTEHLMVVLRGCGDVSLVVLSRCVLVRYR